MRYLQIGGYKITTPILAILQQLKLRLTNGKLREIKPSGDNIVVTCPNPLHAGGKEHTAACNIYIGDNPKIRYGFARCFVCGFEKPFAQFVAECLDSSLAAAEQWLISNFGVKSEATLDIGSDIKLSNKRTNLFTQSSQIAEKERWEPIANLPAWCEYFKKRHLSVELCEQFNLRYNPKTRQVIFPCYDSAGHLIMTPTRNIDNKIFYLDKDVEKPLYCIDKVVKHNCSKVVLTEGPFDALTCWMHKVPAVATLGNPSESQIEQINTSTVQVVYLAFDNDTWGKKFADFVKYRLDPRILVRTVKFPDECKDPNDIPETLWEAFILENQLPQIKK